MMQEIVTSPFFVFWLSIAAFWIGVKLQKLTWCSFMNGGFSFWKAKITAGLFLGITTSSIGHKCWEMVPNISSITQSDKIKHTLLHYPII